MEQLDVLRFTLGVLQDSDIPYLVVRSITGMLATSPEKIDRTYVERWVMDLGVSDEPKAVVARL